ncbi:divergent PAP2 family protein [Thermoclostridium caenicola]|uniref:divergent PAP2 family protein n=1 Tax=Thermoclostridium caenicola TaxID=659425 RepID=UPI00122C99C6|nr:divergent PAP2 family protein [Thermoclostridium caenicola]HOP71753.1 divergent PAP2 family protein [Thermoclostridium caenicola]
MNVTFFEEIINNKALILPVFSWFLAQFYKFLHCLVVNKKIDFMKFVSSGGMPSSHSAISVCLATMMGLQYGFGSGIFAFAAVFSFIVMADAAGVRRAAGKQAALLNKLANATKQFRPEKDLKELLGHTPVEVFAGAALGILVALVFA